MLQYGMHYASYSASMVYIAFINDWQHCIIKYVYMGHGHILKLWNSFDFWSNTVLYVPGRVMDTLKKRVFFKNHQKCSSKNMFVGYSLVSESVLKLQKDEIKLKFWYTF